MSSNAPSYPIDSTAAAHLQTISVDVHNSILVVSAEVAKRDKIHTIHVTHIDEARNLISPKRVESRRREMAKVTGGALLGAFFPGFYASLPIGTTPVSVSGLIVYTAFGITGVLLLWYGYSK